MIKNYWLLLFISLAMPVSFIYSGQIKNNALEQNIAAAPTPKEKLEAIIKYCEAFATTNPSAVNLYADKGIAIANKLSNIRAMGILYKSKGVAGYFSGNYDLAAKNYFIAAKFLEQISDKVTLAYLHNDIAKLFRKTGHLKKAHAHYNLSHKLFTELKDSNGIAMIINEHGVVYEYEKNYDKAINNYLTSLTIMKELNDSVGMSYSLNFIGTAYMAQGKPDLANLYLDSALTIRLQLNDTFSLALTYSDIGSVQLIQLKYKEAINSFNKSNSFFPENNYPELISHNYNALAECYRQLNLYKTADSFFLQHIALKDSIFSLEKNKQITELETLYQTEKKDLEIERATNELNNQKLWMLIMVTTLFFALIIGSLMYKKNRMKQQAILQQQQIEQQKILNKAIIETEEQERKRIAKDLHDGVGQQLSAVKMNLSAYSSSRATPELDNVLNMLDDAVKEVRSVSHSMIPNALLHAGLVSAIRDFMNRIALNNKIEVDVQIIDIKQRLEEKVETTLYRIIQECVSNILKHAEATKLTLQLINHENHLTLMIEDNGKGFDTQQQFPGIGIKNIESRVAYINGHMYLDSHIERGTTITVEIPH